MTTIKDGEPAFPCQAEGWTRSDASGLTARQYAAIHLRVPDSGTDWLDDMIRKAQRDYFAAKAMQGLCANDGYNNHSPATIANEAYGMADAMLAARECK
ncbi:hypothetical protein [Cupriavidus gilardii]|uniref:hypothetical protein n=1 Tax=Cupriavidus gilardii TaxID=82541 RepID=UPI001580E5ED|nr:hypothetical protein [Cupriavidus gilardii]QKS60447.1 hypothetical protein FOB47_02515 [Cupriavidus gilardii]